MKIRFSKELARIISASMFCWDRTRPGGPGDRRATGWLFQLVALWLVAFTASWMSSGCQEELPPKPHPVNTAESPTFQPAPVITPHQDLKGKRVLLVHSYHEGYPWVDTITEGVKSKIQGSGLVLDIFHMDTKRHTDKAWKIEAGQHRKKVDEFHPDIILASDDDAQQYFAMSYLNTTLPIVFTGVDADPSKYGYPAANVTGIIERPHFRESLELAQQLRPLRRVAVLSCHDSTSIVALGFMKQEQVDVEIVEWLMIEDFEEWKEAISRFNHSVDALVIRSYQAVKKAGSMENVNPREVARWTRENARIPTIAFHDFEIEDGLLVGVVKSGQAYGALAADYAIRILQGTPPPALPIMKPRQGIPMVNRTTAHKLGILRPEDLAGKVKIVSWEEHQ